MPTRPRIDLAGYHHIINRGVNRADVFHNADDRDTGLSLISARDRALFKKRKVTQSQRGIYLKHGKGVAVGVG